MLPSGEHPVPTLWPHISVSTDPKQFFSSYYTQKIASLIKKKTNNIFENIWSPGRENADLHLDSLKG